MSNRITDEQRIEDFFLKANKPECRAMQETIRVIMRVRFDNTQTPKRGRPRKTAAAKPKELEA